MKVAVVTLEGFNELDSFIASAMLNRAKGAGLEAVIVGPDTVVTSMNGVRVHPQAPLDELPHFDAVLLGSGTKTRDYAKDERFMASLALSPEKQLVGAQCSGTLLLAKKGLLSGLPACTDTKTKPWVLEAGIEVLEQPFVAIGNVATAGGCLSSQYLAGWTIARLVGWQRAREIIHYVAPVGQKDEFVARAAGVLNPYLAEAAMAVLAAT